MSDVTMLRRGHFLEETTRINLKPFRSEFFLVTTKYDLDCLVAYLKLITNSAVADDLDWSGVETTEDNYCLLTVGSVQYSTCYCFLYAPILLRLQPGSLYLGVLSRLMTLVTEICVTTVRQAGYDPSLGSVTFSHLVGQAYFDLGVKIGALVNGMTTMATADHRAVMQGLTPEQWAYVANLDSVTLYSLARNASIARDNGVVNLYDNGWNSTTYYS